MYHSWSTVSGYFDGDGTVEFSIRGFRIETRLAFDENWEPQLNQLRRFLLEHDVIPGRVRRKGSSRTWHVVVSKRSSVIRMARAMIPYTMKKRRELQAVVNYLAGRTTGAEFVREMNRDVRIGERIGKLRKEGPPYTHLDGVKRSRYLAELKRRRKRTTAMSKHEVEQIIRDRMVRGLKFSELSSKYGYSRWVLRRVLRQAARVKLARTMSGRA